MFKKKFKEVGLTFKQLSQRLGIPEPYIGKILDVELVKIVWASANAMYDERMFELEEDAKRRSQISWKEEDSK